MKFRSIAVAGVILVLAGCGKKPEELGGQSSPNSSDKDNKFITAITEADMMDGQTGEMAERSSKNKAVTDYAKELVTDHAEVKKQVEATAKAVTAVPPTELDSSDTSTLNDLKTKTGAPFDEAFAKAEVSIQDKVVDAANDELKSGTNGQVKKLAADLLPTLQKDQTAAKTLKEAVDKYGATTRPGM